MYSVILAGSGSYVPEKIVSNVDLESKIDTSDTWIVERTGIRNRHIAEKGVGASDLALPAVKKAMEAACVCADEIDLIVTGTSTPDMGFPSTSCFIQQKAKIKQCIAFDVTAACSGFIYALSVAEQYIRAGGARNALVVGSEVMSSIVDWKDRNTCVLFGDGAGAVVIKRGEPGSERGIIDSRLYSDGNYGHILNHPGFGSLSEGSEEYFNSRAHYLKMKGPDTFKMAVRFLSSAFKKTLDDNNLKPSDIDLFVVHQANIRIIQMIAKNLSLPDEKVFKNISKYGNTSSASIPIALDEAIRGGRIKEGALVLLGAFGGGLTWGTTLIRI